MVSHLFVKYAILSQEVVDFYIFLCKIKEIFLKQCQNQNLILLFIL